MIVDVKATPVAAVRAAPAPTGHQCSKATTVRFGKSKGKCLHEIDAADLDWQLSAARKSVEAKDPKWGKVNEEWCAMVEAEAARRVMG